MPSRTIADQLRESIGASRLTAYRLGQLTDIDPGIIQRFLNGQRDIRLETAGRIASALGLKLAPKGRGSRPAVDPTSDDMVANPEVETPQPPASAISEQTGPECMLVKVGIPEVADEPAALSNAVIPEPADEVTPLTNANAQTAVVEPDPVTEPAPEPLPADMVPSPQPAAITPFLARLRGQGGGV